MVAVVTWSELCELELYVYLDGLDHPSIMRSGSIPKEGQSAKGKKQRNFSITFSISDDGVR